MGQKLFMRVVTKIPYVYHSTPSTVSQAVVYFNFGDSASGVHFWYGVAVYDNRGYQTATGSATGYFISYDKGTASPNVLSTLGVHSPFIHTESGSFSSQPWNEYRTLSFSVQPSHIINAVRQLKQKFAGEARVQQMSENPATYTLGHANVNPEIYSPEPLNRNMFAHMGMAIKEFSYYVQ